MDVDEERLRARAGSALREFGHALVGREAPAELLVDISETLDGLTARLAAAPMRTRDPAALEQRWRAATPEGGVPRTFDDRPISGRASPWGLDLDVHRHGDEIDARVVLREAHEGAPGRSHGGVVAALFDDVFGYILGVIGQPAFTGELTVRYVKGTPLHHPLSCRVRPVGRDGRLIRMTGELVDVATDEELARATALFIAVDFQRFGRASAELPAPPDEH